MKLRVVHLMVVLRRSSRRAERARRRPTRLKIVLAEQAQTVVYRLWLEKGERTFGEDCVHEHKAVDKGASKNGDAAQPKGYVVGRPS